MKNNELKPNGERVDLDNRLNGIKVFYGEQHLPKGRKVKKITKAQWDEAHRQVDARFPRLKDRVVFPE